MSIPLIHEIADRLRQLLPAHRDDASVYGVLLDAHLTDGELVLAAVRIGFCKSVKSFLLRSSQLWAAWAELDIESDVAAFFSSGTYPEKQIHEIRRAGVTFPPVAIPITELPPLDETLANMNEHIPADHRVTPRLDVHVNLTAEGDVLRWRLQYEVPSLGFRVLELDAQSGAVLYDVFDTIKPQK